MWRDSTGSCSTGRCSHWGLPKPSGGRWCTLVHVYYYDGISRKELSELLEADKSATGKLLRKLEENGWINRATIESDRRAQKIFLTDSVRPLMQSIIRLSDTLIARSIEGISEPRLKALQAGIKQLDNRLDELIENTPEDVEQLRESIRKDIDLLNNRRSQELK